MGVTLEEENKDLGVGANCHCCWSDSDRTWEPGTVVAEVQLQHRAAHIHTHPMSRLLILFFP